MNGYRCKPHTLKKKTIKDKVKLKRQCVYELEQKDGQTTKKITHKYILFPYHSICPYQGRAGGVCVCVLELKCYKGIWDFAVITTFSTFHPTY